MFFYIYVGVCVAMMASAIWRAEDRLQFPFLAGGTVLLMVCVPLNALMLDPSRPSDVSLQRFIFMAILCQGATWAGYHCPWRFTLLSDYKFDPQRLKISALALTVFGFYFAYRLANTEIQYSAENGNFTGIATIYITLAQVSRYGFVLAAILFFYTKDKRMLLVMVPQIILYGKLFLAGRRSATGEFLIIVMTLLFFYRKKCIPLWLLLPGMIMVAVFSYNIGTVRTTKELPLGERIRQFIAAKPLESLKSESQIEDRRYVEISNAVNFMDSKVLGGHYTFGLHFWNQLVFGFVPAQFVGVEFKKSLQFDLADDTALTSFEKPTGTCESGIAEAFMAFGYFGCVLFFIMGAGFRWLWLQAVRGNVAGQFILMLFILPGILSFTIQLWTLVNAAVNLIIFASPFLWWSALNQPRVRGGRHSKRKAKLASETVAGDLGTNAGLDLKTKVLPNK